MRLHPEATFDALFVANKVQLEVGSFVAQDIHLLAYLGCLLWLYRGLAVSDWGYPFVGTELGAPYSRDIDTALDALQLRGYFVRARERLRVTEAAHEALSDLVALSLNQDRAECLGAACASTTAFSLGMVGSAVAEEPDLRRARDVPMKRRLLEQSAHTQLFKQFDALRQALHQKGNDLRVPSVVWLEALYRCSSLNKA